MDNQRLILFVVFSFSLLLLWDAWQAKDQPPVATEAQTRQLPASGVPQGSQPAPVPGQQGPQTAGLTSGARAIVETDVMRVEIDANGGDLRKLELIQYHEVDDPKKTLVLLQEKADRPYVIQSGLLWGLPTHKDVFQLIPGTYKLSGETLGIPMTWINPQTGVTVEKTYVFKRGSYRIEVIEKITNSGAQPVRLERYGQLVRNGQPPAGESRFMYTFTGPAVYTESAKFQKINFDDIADGDADFQKSAKDGWVGMLQHHFVAAWLPRTGSDRTYYVDKLGDDLYSAGYKQAYGMLAAGQSMTLNSGLYVGPQIQKNLEAAAPGLDLTRDYGWLTPLAAPMFWIIEKIHVLVGNWGWSIVIFTVLLKLALFPLSASGYKGMAQMRALAPKLQKMKEMYGEDRQKLHQAMADMYKKEKVNPLGGCMPILLQIPVFIALYYVLIAAVEMRGAPWMGWITDLSAPDPFYVLPVLMGITSIIQVKLNPTPPDPIQAKVMMAMPIVFSVMFIFFASGLVLYWLVNNILSIAQQWYMNKKFDTGSAAAHANK
ncbi:MAG: membrane protein insertase YidC [Hydrogenophilaceae bacterium]|nr:membrane protein insertase YidC [Hydrogenophilaceae bacterium]